MRESSFAMNLFHLFQRCLYCTKSTVNHFGLVDAERRSQIALAAMYTMCDLPSGAASLLECWFLTKIQN